MIAGDFSGTGQVLIGRLYRPSAQGLRMPIAGSSLRTEHIAAGQIESLEVATDEGIKSLAGSFGWGVVGGLAGGPVGAIAGVLAGGNSREIKFICKFKDGRKFLGSCKSDTYVSIQAASFAITAPFTRIVTTYMPTAPLRDACLEGRHYACGAKECSCNCHQRAQQLPQQKKRTVGVATALILLIAIILLVVARRSSKSTTPLAPELDQTVVKFVSSLVVDDIRTGFSGQKSATPNTPDDNPSKWIAVDREVTAKQYEAAYTANEISADDEFKGKRIMLSGTIDSIEKDFAEAGFLTLRGSEPLLGVHAELSKNSMLEAASFRRGQNVNLVCRGAGRVGSVAILGSCEPLSDYMNEAFPAVESRVTEFLSGKIALPRATASMLTMLYMTGRSLPADSPCLNGKMETCEAEVTPLYTDAAKLQGIQDQASRMMSSLQVNPK